jgi:hypothetical protein
MEIVFAILGFVVGAIIGMAAFALVVGERRANYRVLAARHPWIRLVLILWIVACGSVVAFFGGAAQIRSASTQSSSNHATRATKSGMRLLLIS